MSKPRRASLRSRVRPAWLLAVAAGILSSTAFDPLSWRVTMVLGVALLIGVLRSLGEVRRRSVLLLGFGFGLGFMGPLIWWMRAVSSGAFVGLVLAQAVLIMLTVLALWRVCRLPGWPVWIAAVWVAGEWVRGTFPFTGFPWGRLAHTTIDTPLEAWVRLIGMPATSALLALVAAAVVVLVTDSSLRPRLLAVGGAVLAVAIGSVLPTGLAGEDGSARIALVQGGVPGTFLAWPRGEIFELHAAATDTLVDDISAGRRERPDLVLWPENATDIDPSTDAGIRRRIEDLSADLGAPILVGGIFDGPTSDEAYNAGVVWDEDGPGDRYIKRRPVPYGEYVPFRDSLGGILPRFDRDIPRNMLAGEDSGAIDIGGIRIGDTICYDIVYDDVVADAIADGAQVLVVQTSNAAFSDTSQPEQQWDISRLRAIETGRWVVVPSTNGISGIADASGDTVARAPYDEPTVIDDVVPLASSTTPAGHIGRPLEMLLVVLGVGAWIRAAWQVRTRRTSIEIEEDAA